MGDRGRGESEPLDAGADGAEGAADVVPEFVAAAFAQLDAALEVLQGLAWSPLSPAEVRATLRGLTARQGALVSAGWRGLVGMDARDDVVPRGAGGAGVDRAPAGPPRPGTRCGAAGITHGAPGRPGHR